jgi:hypothetical protein
MHEQAVFTGNSDHLANLPNDISDGSALAHKLSAQLQRAEERINQLERERDGFFDQLLADGKAAIQDVQTNADARLKRTIREADERVTQLQAEAEIEIGHLHDELSEVTRDIDQLKADADERVECVKRETNDRVAMMENETKKRYGCHPTRKRGQSSSPRGGTRAGQKSRQPCRAVITRSRTF